MKERAYQHKLRIQLNEWQGRIEELRRRIRKAAPDARLEFEYQIQDLLAKQAAARRKLQELERAGGTVTRAARARAGDARDRFQRALRRIVSGSR